MAQGADQKALLLPAQAGLLHKHTSSMLCSQGQASSVRQAHGRRSAAWAWVCTAQDQVQRVEGVPDTRPDTGPTVPLTPALTLRNEVI